MSSRVDLRNLRITGASASSGVRVDAAVLIVNVANCCFAGNQTAFESGTVPGVSFTHNTCYGPQGIWASGGSFCVLINNVVHATGAWALRTTGCAADYNVYFAPSGAVATDGTNLYATLAAWRGALGQDAHSLGADPLLANPAAGDLHLQPGSPAKDMALGGATGLPVADAEGYARGTGVGPDGGAFEIP